jgi:uncharacterized protein YeaO (DUF488 family)
LVRRLAPNLAPSNDTMKLGQAAETPAQWSAFCKQYKAELATLAARHDLALLAALSHTTNLSVGCYSRAGVPLSSRHLARAADAAGATMRAE